MFGNPIRLSYHGGEIFTTHAGAVSTVIMYIILFAYAIQGLTEVLSNKVRSLTVENIHIDKDTYPGFSPANATYYDDPTTGFNIAFGF